MKHKIINKQNLGNHQLRVEVLLLPSNNSEEDAINRFGKLTASNEERELIDSYLSFGLVEIGNYSIIKASQSKSVFIVEVFLNEVF